MSDIAVRLLVAAAIVVVAALVAGRLRRHRLADSPTQPRCAVPVQLDRADFAAPGCPWLVVVFSSETCSTCADVIRKVEVLRSAQVAVDVVSFQLQRPLHERYAVDAVPCVLVADHAGVVTKAFVGPVSAADLWASVAEARAPGSVDALGRCEPPPE